MKRKVIIQICGGLGNQIFQYLFGISRFDPNIYDILFDISDCLDPNNPRKFALDQLGLPGNYLHGRRHIFNHDGVEYASLRDITWLQRGVGVECGSKIEGRVGREDEINKYFPPPDPSGDQFYFGYWQSSNYWSSDFLELRTIGTAALKLIESNRNAGLIGAASHIDELTCAVHVRGEDYLQFLDYHGVCQVEYYKNAFIKFPNHKFHVFTNDIEYAKKIIPQSSEVIFIADSIRDDFLEFSLLTQYSNYIIPNSSYSYLAAMVGRSLRGKQNVIAPYPWYSFPKNGPEFPVDWIKLNRSSGNTVDEDLSLIDGAKISVIMPVYQRHEYLEDALKSVVEQTRAPYEIIISQNAASDEVKQEVHRLSSKYPNIKVVNSITPNSLSHARNVAIEQAEGDFIAILDDDDIWVKNKLELQLKNLVLMGATVCASNFHEINMKGEFQWASSYPAAREMSWAKALTYQNLFSGGSAAMIRREVFKRVGLFDVNLPSCEDHDMWRRMAVAGERLLFIEDDLVGIRKAGGNMSGNLPLRLRGELIHLSKMIGEPNSSVEVVRNYYKDLRGALNSFLAEQVTFKFDTLSAEVVPPLIKPAAKSPILNYHHLSYLKVDFLKIKKLWIQGEREQFLRLGITGNMSFTEYMARKYLMLLFLLPIEVTLFIGKKLVSKFKAVFFK